MKWKLAYLTLLLGISCTTWAQGPLQQRFMHLPEAHPARVELTAWLSEQYNRPIELLRFQSDSSLIGWHQSFWIQFKGQTIQDAIVRYHQYRDGSAKLSAPKHIGFFESEGSANDNGLIQRWSKQHPQVEILNAEPRWLLQNDSLLDGLSVTFRRDGIQYEQLIQRDGQAALERVRSVFDRPDTTVLVNVYQPDPITFLESTYGPIEDNNDADSPELTEALIRDSITLRWDENSEAWNLRSDYAQAEDFHSIIEPNNPRIDPPAPAAASAASLEVTRASKDFEYYHVFYHMHRSQAWLQSMGFSNLVNYPLAFDAHASTSDQSSFEPLGVNSRLRFGDGGVDDAEDADVIVHEYGHAITSSAAPETNFGGERAALDEGFCDYLAISYSRQYSDYQRDLVFNWDGHNEFWDGRTLTNERTYPTDKTFDIYADGILWASALDEISDFIGLEQTDRTAIQSVYEWYPNMLLSDAARLFLRADTLLNNATNSELASIVLCDRGLLPGCEDTLLSALPFSEPYLGNTEDFAFNNEPVYIFPNGVQINTIEVIDLHGRTLYEEEWENSDELFYPYNGSGLRQGSYILRLHTNEGPYSFKLIRTWL